MYITYLLFMITERTVDIGSLFVSMSTKEGFSQSLKI